MKIRNRKKSATTKVTSIKTVFFFCSCSSFPREYLISSLSLFIYL